MPVDVQALGCDFLSATGRKFLRGPRGSGFLYVRKALIEGLEPVMIDHSAASWVARDRFELRGDARRFESWEHAYALRCGLQQAIRYARGIALAAIQQRAWMLAAQLRDALRGLVGVRVHDLGTEHCAIVSFSVDGLDPRATVHALRAMGINISVCPPASTRLDSEQRQLPSLLRASPHYCNTEDELHRFIGALQALRARG